MIKIDLSDLISKYDDNLLDNLRGFGSETEFLKFWVPGTNSLKSFYNLIDALYEANNYDFTLLFKENLFDKKSLDNLRDFLNKISSYKFNRSQAKFEFEIKIDKKLYDHYKKNNFSKNYKQKTEIVDKKSKIKKFVSQNNIERQYLNNLKNIKCNDYFSNKIRNSENIFFRKFGQYRLNFIIKDKIVVKLFHNCEDNEELRKLINIFFDICLNKNIQEVSDHSVIYLEEKIRILSKNLIKQGIILPSHGGQYFDHLNKIVREIFEDYRVKNSIQIGVNKNYFRKSYDWVNLPEVEKVKKIELILKQIRNDNLMSDQSLVVQSIDSNFRVNLAINDEFRRLQSKKNILLETEIKLKELDNTLEVFIDEVLDKNKLRLKNSPQTKLLN